MNTQSRVNGFEVRVLDGREITAGEFERLDSAAQAKVVTKINGPHVNAKWAKDRAARKCLQYGFGLTNSKQAGHGRQMVRNFEYVRAGGAS